MEDHKIFILRNIPTCTPRRKRISARISFPSFPISVCDPRRAWFMTSPANYHEAGPDTQGDITDIDSIIEINGRGIVTTVETQWFITGQMQGTATAVSVVVKKEYPGNGTSWDHKVSWTRLNVSTGEGLIYSRSGRESWLISAIE